LDVHGTTRIIGTGNGSGKGSGIGIGTRKLGAGPRRPWPEMGMSMMKIHPGVNGERNAEKVLVTANCGPNPSQPKPRNPTQPSPVKFQLHLGAKAQKILS